LARRQVDLGALATVDHVSLWHRTDCCQDRLEGAQIYVSTTSMYSQVRCSVITAL
jgi:hypothetical protein